MAIQTQEKTAVYVCLEEKCLTAFPRWGSLNLHYKQVHHGVETPSVEDCKVDDLPEGFTLKTGQKSAASSTGDRKENPPAESAASTKEPTAGTIARVDKRYPAGMGPDTDDADRLGSILETYGAKTENIEKIKKVYRFDRSLQTNPHNLEVVLKTWLEKELHQLISMIVGQFFGTAVDTDEAGDAKYIPIGYRRTVEGAYQPVFSLPGGQFGRQTYRIPGMQEDNNPIFIYPGNPPAEGVKTDPETVKKIETLEASNQQLFNQVEALIAKLNETEEQKKEAALNARFEKLEQMIAELAKNPKTDDKDKNYEALMGQLQETKTEIGKMREEAAQNRITNLEQQIAALSSQIKNQDDERITKLEADLAEAKAERSKVVTGRTEMDVISDLATKAIETVKEAGKDVKSIMMSSQNKERFSPDRVDPSKRKAAGEKLAEAIETEANLSEAERSYLHQ